MLFTPGGLPLHVLGPRAAHEMAGFLQGFPVLAPAWLPLASPVGPGGQVGVGGFPLPSGVGWPGCQEPRVAPGAGGLCLTETRTWVAQWKASEPCLRGCDSPGSEVGHRLVPCPGPGESVRPVGLCPRPEGPQLSCSSCNGDARCRLPPWSGLSVTRTVCLVSAAGRRCQNGRGKSWSL